MPKPSAIFPAQFLRHLRPQHRCRTPFRRLRHFHRQLRLPLQNRLLHLYHRRPQNRHLRRQPHFLRRGHPYLFPCHRHHQIHRNPTSWSRCPRRSPARRSHHFLQFHQHRQFHRHLILQRRPVQTQVPRRRARGPVRPSR